MSQRKTAPRWSDDASSGGRDAGAVATAMADAPFRRCASSGADASASVRASRSRTVPSDNAAQTTRARVARPKTYLRRAPVFDPRRGGDFALHGISSSRPRRSSREPGPYVPL